MNLARTLKDAPDCGLFPQDHTGFVATMAEFEPSVRLGSQGGRFHVQASVLREAELAEWSRFDAADEDVLCWREEPTCANPQ